MKIVTWNCNGAFRKKREHLAEFNADILIIQECENPATAKDEDYKECPHLWIGDNPHKGLGIFAAKNVTLRKLKWNDEGLRYFIPCRINKQFTLLAAWCHGNTTSFPYIGQFWKYFHLHQSKFRNCLLAGDFNSNTIWDKPKRTWNHSDVIRELKKKNIESLYHQHFREEQGKEITPTLFLQRNVKKPYHLDYIFGSRAFQNRVLEVTIGSPKKWLALSDHMPVVCELKD